MHLTSSLGEVVRKEGTRGVTYSLLELRVAIERRGSGDDKVSGLLKYCPSLTLHQK